MTFIAHSGFAGVRASKSEGFLSLQFATTASQALCACEQLQIESIGQDQTILPDKYIAAHPRLDKTAMGGMPPPRLRSGKPAAHRRFRLMLLPSGSDMVHRRRLHGTRPSTPKDGASPTYVYLGAGIQPCCSGLQVQGAANSPPSAANFLTVLYFT